MNIALIVNLTKENAVSAAREIVLLMNKNDARVLTLSEYRSHFADLELEYADTADELFNRCDVAVTVGGDGTIIHAAKYAAYADKPLIGVNVGRLGFAADVEINEIGMLTSLLSGDYITDKRLLLDIEVQSNGKTSHYLAVNEAVVAHGQLSKIVDLHLSLNGKEISSYRADGLLFATPTGSTAYSLSAGGPIVSPKLNCILMTPVCPHSLFSRSVIFEDESVLSVSVTIPMDCSCVLTIDGVENINITENDRIIIRKSKLSLKLLSVANRNFYVKLNEKLKEREIR